MDSNEARVREVWERVGGYDCADLGLGCGVHLIYQDKCLHHFGEFTHAAAAWSAAAAYTETVLREAAELREERGMVISSQMTCAHYVNLSVSDEDADKWRRRYEVWSRILARLEAIYAAHIRGITPEALK